MVYINDEKFKIYSLDTVDSILTRLANKLNTLPDYLYFPDFEGKPTIKDFHSEKNIKVEDLLQEIKNSAEKNGNILDLIESIKKKVSKTFKLKDKIIIPWFVYNKILENNEKKQGSIALDKLAKDLNESIYFFSESSVLRDWKARNKKEDEINFLMEYGKNRIKNNKKMFKSFDKTEANFYTDLEYEKISFDILLDIEDISILELFNYVVLNKETPFVSIDQFYKILKDFLPSEEWENDNEENIGKMLIKVLDKSNVYNIKLENFGNVVVKKVEDQFIASFTVHIKKGNINKEEFVKRFLNVFPTLEMKIKETVESKVVGIFYLPQQMLNRYVFADLVMNDDLFSSLINIDESDKATKKKTGLYIHFNHPLTNHITANITQKIMKKNDIEMKKQDSDLFPVGDPYTKFRVSAESTEKFEIFRELISKLFSIYNDKVPEILDIYREYIPDFGSVEEEIEDIVVMNKLEDVAPDIFVKNYSRVCPHVPRIVSVEEANDAIEQGKSIIKFPRDVPDDKDVIKFPMDGEDQNYYMCDHLPDHKFVGVKVNKLKNHIMYPYIPHCYKTEQIKKPAFKHYYNGIEPKIKEDKHSKIIKTDKILKNNQFGYLPDELYNLFTLIDPDPNFSYIRKGVFRNENSFLNCVMEALYEDTGIIDIEDEDEREAFLIDKRKKFANHISASLCRQELYDKNVDEIIEMIKDGDQYLDPKLFIRLLEEEFDCNIYIFLEYEMILPRHLYTYYKNQKRSKCVYIYEHMGTVSGRLKYPQCELIIKYDNKSDAQYSFSYDEAKHVKNIYEMLRSSYVLNSKINEIVGIPWESNIQIISQKIDSYGKTRQLNIRYKSSFISILTTPLQPVKAVETKSSKIYLADSIDIVLKLAKKLDIIVTSQTVVGDVVKQIDGMLGNIKVNIPVVDSIKRDDIPEIEDTIDYSDKKTSVLEIYNKNKKLARYLVEYVYWMYSRYLVKNDIDKMNDDNVVSFFKNNVEIDEEYNYEDNVEKKFTRKSTFFRDKKIIVTSEEMLKRLVYVLRLAIVRNMDMIKEYNKQKFINHYYVDISDFDVYDNQVILYGDNSVEKWIHDNISYKLHAKIVIGTVVPYFFKNKLIDDNVYLAQNTNNIEKAMDIAWSWNKIDHNVGIYAEKAKSIFSFDLYVYKNEYDIEEMKIEGKDKGAIKILGYKIDDMPFYTVLLNL